MPYRSANLRRFLILLNLMSPRRRVQLAVVTLLMLISAGAELVTIGSVIPFLAFAANPESNFGGEWVRWFLGFFHPDPVIAAAIVLAVAAIVSGALRFALLRADQRFVVAFGHELASRVYSRTIRQEYILQIQRNSNVVMAGIMKVQDVVYGYLQPLLQAVVNGFIAGCIGLLLFWIAPAATAISAAVIGLAYLAIHAFTAKQVALNAQAVASNMTSRTQLIQESFGAIREMIIDGTHQLSEARFQSMDAAHRRAVGSNIVISGTPRFLIEAVGIWAIVAVILFVGQRDNGILEALPILGALALGAQRLLPLIQATWAGAKLSEGNLQNLLDVEELARQPIAEGFHLQDSIRPLPFADRMVFDEVQFAYPDGAPAISGASFEIRRGEHFGIQGTTGAGKSTLLDLILGLLEPQEGEIRIDATRLDAVTRRAWQTKIAHVPQSVFLSDDTIAANIALGRPGCEIDRERIVAAIETAQLRNFVQKLPNGLETKVGERGVRISGGQRQRIGIARALYKNPEVLVLDEATSALDDDTEAAVMDAIAAHNSDLTIISVSHRSGSLERCDRVLTLDQGRIARIRGANRATAEITGASGSA